jgi:hypothetical protein
MTLEYRVLPSKMGLSPHPVGMEEWKGKHEIVSPHPLKPGQHWEQVLMSRGSQPCSEVKDIGADPEVPL